MPCQWVALLGCYPIPDLRQKFPRHNEKQCARIGQLQFTSLLVKQFFADGLLEYRQLAADSGLGKVQFFTSCSNAAFGNDMPKINKC